MFLLDPPLLKLPMAIIVLVMNLIFPGTGFIVSGFLAQPRDVVSWILGAVVIVLFYAIPIGFYVIVGLFNAIVGNSWASVLFLPLWIGVFFVWIYNVIWVKCRFFDFNFSFL